jgi:hypothetical protein
MDTQKYRETLLDRAAQAFARDALDEAGLEAFIARVQDAQGEAELRAASAFLAPLVPAESDEGTLAEAREIALHMSNLKRRGDWVDAKTYRLSGQTSNFELDYRAYENVRGFAMTLIVDLSMSNLTLIVPPDWEVDCRIDRNSMSNVVDKGPYPSRGSCRIRVEGSLSMSNIRVKRRTAERRRGFFALLFGR